MSKLLDVKVSPDEMYLLDALREARRVVERRPKERKERVMVLIVRPKSPLITYRVN